MVYHVGVNPFRVYDTDRLYWKHDEVELMMRTGIQVRTAEGDLADVYEGDILRVNVAEGDNADEFRNLLVVWLEKAGQFGVTDTCYGFKLNDGPVFTSVYIGNIWQNPEVYIESI